MGVQKRALRVSRPTGDVSASCTLLTNRADNMISARYRYDMVAARQGFLAAHHKPAPIAKIGLCFPFAAYISV
jgi:hypothetical protein